MRVKRTLPPRTTVVEHEGATEGERIEHRTVGGRQGMPERGWRMLASVVAEVPMKGMGPRVDRERERCNVSEEGEKHGWREGGCWLRGPRTRERERCARVEGGSGARGERTRGMLGRFRRDWVHAEWSTVVCVRPRSSEDAPGCSRDGWTTLVATAASRHRGFSHYRRVDRFRESRDKREKHWCR